MRHLTLGSLLIGIVVAIIAVALGVRGESEVAHAGPGDVTLVAIDMDTTNNDDSSVGTIQDCKELANIGDTWTFDLVVQGVDAADKIAGYQFDIDYDPSVIQVDSVIDVDAGGSTPPNDISIISRIASSGGVGLLSLSDWATNPNSMTLAAADGTTNPTPPDNHESGDGVLARVTVTAVGTGVSPLLIPSTLGGADGNRDTIISAGDGPQAGQPIPISTVEGAAISVGEPCVLPTPAPTPTPTPTPTLTPVPTPTPAPILTPTPAPTATGTPGPGPTFNPCSLWTISDSSPGANADIESAFGVGIGADCQSIPADPSDPRDLMFRTLMGFTPPEWGVARDEDIPDGAIVAQISARATLGLIGDGCANSLGVGFDMMDATTNMSVLVPFQDPEEEFDPPDRNDSQGDEPDDQFDIGADGLPLGVTRYPDYLTRVLQDPGGNVLTPIARLYGQTEVAGIEQSLNIVLFEPGTVFLTPGGDTIVTDPRLGYPSLTLLDAGGDPAAEADIEDNNTVSDFCSPIEIRTTVFGLSRDNPQTALDEAGHPVRTNPPDGAYDPLTYAVSQYDADSDGIENPLDPCPTIANPNWDPRLKTNNPSYAGDQDRDSLPDECDPDPNDPSPIAGGVRDEDRDWYGNRGDNCPLVANSAGQLGGSGSDNQADSDSDGIGDACDPNPDAPDGQRFRACVAPHVTIGAGGPSPDPPQDMQPCNPSAPLPGEPTPTPTTTPTPTPAPSTTPTPASTPTTTPDLTPTPAHMLTSTPTSAVLGQVVEPTAAAAGLPNTGGQPPVGDNDGYSVWLLLGVLPAVIAVATGAWYARRRLS